MTDKRELADALRVLGKKRFARDLGWSEVCDEAAAALQAAAEQEERVRGVVAKMSPLLPHTCPSHPHLNCAGCRDLAWAGCIVNALTPPAYGSQSEQ